MGKEVDDCLTLLDAVFSKYNSEDILSTLIELQLFSEMGKPDDKKMQKAEWLAANLLRYNIKDSAHTFSHSNFMSLNKLAERAVFGKVLYDAFENIHEKAKAPDEEKRKIFTSILMKAKNQVYRGDGYLEQLVSFAEKLYSEFDNEFKVTLGFSYTTCQKIFIYVFQQYQYKSIDLFKKNFRLGKMIKTFIDTMLRNTKLLNQSISGGYVFRVYKKELYEVFDKEEIDAIISVLGRKLGDVSITYHNIGDLNPLCEKPIVNFDDYIYVPLPLLTLQNLPKLFHYYFIADKRFDKNTRAKYKKYRGDVIENLVISYLGRLFDRKKIYHSLKYDIDKEADLTVQQSDVTLFCECKSKVLTLSSLQGDFDSIQSDFNKAIGESFKQAIRTKTWLSEDHAFFATDDNGNTHNVNLKSTRYKYVICIVAEHFGWIPANIKDYLQPDELDNLLPVVSTIFDLDIITRECKNKFEFISYLQSRLDNFDKVSSMDELECFCLLKANGFQKIEIDSDILTPIGYTSEIDRKYHKLDTEWLFNYKM